MAPVALIIASDLHKELGGHRLLNGVSFKLERRERMTVAGRIMQRAKYVTRQTLRVDAHQRRPGVHLAHHQRHCLFGSGAIAR